MVDFDFLESLDVLVALRAPEASQSWARSSFPSLGIWVWLGFLPFLPSKNAENKLRSRDIVFPSPMRVDEELHMAKIMRSSSRVDFGSSLADATSVTFDFLLWFCERGDALRCWLNGMMTKTDFYWRVPERQFYVVELRISFSCAEHDLFVHLRQQGVTWLKLSKKQNQNFNSSSRGGRQAWGALCSKRNSF